MLGGRPACHQAYAGAARCSPRSKRLAQPRSGTLWACSNDLSAMGVTGPSAVKGSALKSFDLKTGASKGSVPLPGERTLCNDIAIGPDGAAYVTDSLSPHILRLKRGSGQFEVWAT